MWKLILVANFVVLSKYLYFFIMKKAIIAFRAHFIISNYFSRDLIFYPFVISIIDFNFTFTLLPNSQSELFTFYASSINFVYLKSGTYATSSQLKFMMFPNSIQTANCMDLMIFKMSSFFTF
jgi:hypothetical protein